jgi:hypothetical protein
MQPRPQHHKDLPVPASTQMSSKKLSNAILPQKPQQPLRDLLPIGLKSEMSRIHKLHHHIRWILPERLCPRRDKNDIVLAPDCEQWHLANSGNSTETVGYKSTFGTAVFQQVELDVLKRSYII